MDGHHAAILCQSALQTCIRSREMVRNLHWHTKMQWNEHNIAMLPWRCHLQGQCSWIPFFYWDDILFCFNMRSLWRIDFEIFWGRTLWQTRVPCVFFYKPPTPFLTPSLDSLFPSPPPPQLKWNRFHHPWLATVDTKKPRFIINCKLS